MKRTGVLFALLVFLSAAIPLFAQELTYTTGETLKHVLSVCIEKKDAVAIVEAHKKSREAAEELWQASERCQNAHVVGAKVGKVTHQVKTADGTVASVVEIVFKGEVVAYFLTTAPVNKAQRNS